MTTLTFGPGKLYFNDRLLGTVESVLFTSSSDKPASVKFNGYLENVSSGSRVYGDICIKRTRRKFQWKAKRGPKRIVCVRCCNTNVRVST